MQSLGKHCPNCLGTGTETIDHPVKDADQLTHTEAFPCPSCLGTGEILEYRTVQQDADLKTWLATFQKLGGDQ